MLRIEMADLEEHAFKRDKRFLVRLILGLAVAAISGLWVTSHLTSDSTGSCAARTFGNLTETPVDAGVR
ncbi:MAG: hypothetical protein IPK60_09430 [Sandaracinaceae bacterium]|jgi:hypothetical protein|nr:hypothetical protein [Sandaracinaceae bacterium]